MGWKTVVLDDLSDDQICQILGLGDQENPEAEHPGCLLAVFPHGKECTASKLPSAEITEIARGQWRGIHNVLSSSHHPWPIMDKVTKACWKPETLKVYPPEEKLASPLDTIPTAPASPLSFRKIIHQRRSAIAYDGITSISREEFYKILFKVIPGHGRIPFNSLPWPTSVHLGLFVHRVDNIPSGLYFLIRVPFRLGDLKNNFHNRFVWTKPEGCPDHLLLYLLEECDCTDLAIRLSCGQDIAGESAFSLGMIAEFEKQIEKYGAWFYRRLFWETGVIGQVLYLEAEAAGLRGTGIGCFFDDPVHEVFGLKGHSYQSLYHFTIGGPVDDPRITTLPPYPVNP